MAEQLLPRREVEKRVGLGRSAIYERMADGKFPKPVKLGGTSAWVESEVDRWVAARIRDRDRLHIASNDDAQLHHPSAGL